MTAARLLSVFGGVGLFLFGMQALTSELKALASETARAAMRRFAGTPLTAFFTGATITALLHSSSASTVMVLRFLGRGM